MSADLALVSAVVVLFALISKRIRPTIISAPMVFAGFGLVMGPEVADIVDLGLELEAVNLLGEFTLAILLFSDASRIDTRALRQDFALPALLLGIGLPLTVALGTLLAWALIGGIGIWEAALIAAILAPTDAALGQEVVSDTAVPPRIRQGLNVESGLNDGLVVPLVTLFTALSLEEEGAGFNGGWVRFVAEQIGFGLLVGVVIGLAGAVLITRAEARDWVDGTYAQLATFALAIGALSTAIYLDGNGFIAAFVAGMIFGTVAPRAHQLGEFTEDTAQLAAAISFFVFGNVLLGGALAELDWEIVVCAVAILTVGRMLPVAVALVGTKAALPTVAFIGWFGPRGLASILFGLGLSEENLPGGDLVAWTVAISILAHGATAAWGARRYGAWWATMSEDERDTMPEGVAVVEHRLRRM